MLRLNSFRQITLSGPWARCGRAMHLQILFCFAGVVLTGYI